MTRILFEKVDDAVYISHLDLMRLFQRALARAGISIRHSQGFNQRPSVSIALPLSLGVASHCELLDFALDGQQISDAEIQRRLNAKLVPGIRVLEAYTPVRKPKEIALLDCELRMEYDHGLPEGAAGALGALFSRAELVLEKRGKSGIVQQDIRPMLRRLEISGQGSELLLRARVCAQNPTLNPAQLIAAIAAYAPQYRPDFTAITRLEIYDESENIFR